MKHVVWATEQDPGDPLAKLILIMLADYANKDTGEAWPSFATLAKACCISRRTCIAKLHTLESKGLIRSEGRRKENDAFTSNKYTFPLVHVVHQVVQHVHHPSAGAAPKPVTEPIENPPRAGVIPDAWQPAQPDGDYASTYPGLDIANEQTRFTAHHRARGSEYRDWEAAWINWLAKSAEFKRRDLGGQRATTRLTKAQSISRENRRRADAYLARVAALPEGLSEPDQ